MVHLDLHHANCLASLFHHRSDLGQEVDRTRLSLGKDVDMVRRHAFLGDEDLFGSIDDEVTSLIKWTLVELVLVLSLELVEMTEVGAEHDRDLEREKSVAQLAGSPTSLQHTATTRLANEDLLLLVLVLLVLPLDLDGVLI